MGQRAVDLCFRRAPLMVQQRGVARTVLGFGTHTLLCAAGGIVPFVLQKFIGKNTLELTLRKLPVALKTIAEGTRQRVALNLPEFSHLNLGEVELQGSIFRSRNALPFGPKVCIFLILHKQIIHRYHTLKDTTILVILQSVCGD